MVDGFLGADVVQLRQLATTFDKQADELATAIISVTNGIKVSAWFGPVAVSFRATWTDQHSLNLRVVETVLRDQAKALRLQAQQQDDASAAAPISTEVHSVGTNDPKVHDWLQSLPTTKDDFATNIKKVNPHYNQTWWGWINNPRAGHTEDEQWLHNCTNCVAAYEMRERGYDVTAIGRDTNRHDDDPIDGTLSCWTDPTTGKPPDRLFVAGGNDVYQAALAGGDGTRLEVGLQWSDGSGGHVFVVQNIGGKVQFIDPQSGKDGITIYENYFSKAESGSIWYVRTDTLDISDNMTDFVKAV